MARRTTSVQRVRTAPNVVPIRRQAPPDVARRRRAPQLALDNAQAVALLMQGQTMPEVAAALGVHRRTLERRLAKPEAQALIIAAEQELLASAKRTLLAHARSGVATLALAAGGRIRHQDGTIEVVPWAQRVSSARALVELGVGRKIELLSAPTVGEETGASIRLHDKIGQITERLIDVESTVVEPAKPKRVRKKA
jgi:hypothetical protein